MDWSNINQTQKKSKNIANVEKFLTNIDMSDEIDKVGNVVLQSALLDCLVKHLRSRPIQTRAYQLLHDLVATTKETSLFSDDDIERTFTLVNSSLKVWEGNEYVSAACFEFLAVLYVKCATRAFPDFDELLLQNALSFLHRLRQSKAVVAAIMLFLVALYESCDDDRLEQLPASASLLALVVDLLSQYGMDSAIAFNCCQVISRLTASRQDYVAANSFKITVVALSTLSACHQNLQFVGLVVSILRNVVREEKHVIYLLDDEEGEFLFICRCLSALQAIKRVDAITAALEVIQRVTHSLFLRTATETPVLIEAIGDALSVARRHHQDCDGECLQEGKREARECSLSEEHLRVSDNIEQMFKTLKGYAAYHLQQQPVAETESEPEAGRDLNTESGGGGVWAAAAAGSRRALTVTLLSASDLINSDLVGVSDPYVILSLPGQSVTSKTINNDLNPMFNQTFSLLWNGSDSLHVEVWDFDAFKPDDPIGYCEVYLADMNITASIATAVDSPLQGVAHGRVQLEVRLRDAPDTPGSESSTLGGSLQVEAEVDPKLEKGGDTSAELALACADTEEEEEERRATTSVGALQQDRVSPDAESGLDSEVNGDATSELDVISPQPYTATAHPPMQEFAPKPKQERRPSYLSTAENDDAMMSMIRALQDELEDWKLKYADMKASRDVLLQVSEEHYGRAMSPQDIQFHSFEGMRTSASADISPIKYQEFCLDETIIKFGAGDRGSGSDEDDAEQDHLHREDSLTQVEGAEEGGRQAGGAARGPARAPGGEGSDYRDSVTGMKSAFSFCTSPSEGRYLDVHELMRGDLGNRAIDHDVATDLYQALKWLFKHLQSIQSTNLEKMVLQMVLPRSLLRKFILEDLMQLLHSRRLQIRDVDIILHNVPSRLKFPDFVFVMVACASKRFAARHNLSAVKYAVVSRLIALVREYREDCVATKEFASSLMEAERRPEGLPSSQHEHEQEQDHQSQHQHSLVDSSKDMRVSSPSKLSTNLKDFGMKALLKQGHVLKMMYVLYAGQRRDKRINFESLLGFAKDFNICPGLISNSDFFDIFDEVVAASGKTCAMSQQPAINYSEFLRVLLEVAIVSNCFGEEDQLIELSTQENVGKKVLNLLWYLESGKGRTHVREKIILPNFKLDRSSFFVEDRLLERKEATTLKLSILKFK